MEHLLPADILHSGLIDHLTAPLHFFAAQEDPTVQYLRDTIPNYDQLGTWQKLFAMGIGNIVSFVISIYYQITTYSLFLISYSSSLNVMDTSVADAWQMSLYFVNFIAVMFIIFLAFANSLRLNIETYEIKKTLPALITGIILANLSFFIISVLMDFADLIVNELTYNTGTPDCPLACQIGRFVTGVSYRINEQGSPILTDNPIKEFLEHSYFFIFVGLVAGFIALGSGGAALPIAFLLVIGSYILAILLGLLPTLLFIILAIIMLGRFMILYLLVAIAPIAIMLYFFPPTKSFGNKYLSQLFSWIFLSPVIYFILYLASLVGQNENWLNL